ncbi:sodium:solute symporter family transporter [Bacillus halotolerans]|uniref:sodium:solute symporter family transporter n=1 Tax=Bacillus TaxID=1386 RepID=UPI0020CE396F|nr:MULTISPECIES: hypothetical protein [Bacillus]MCP9298260.1 hypothetical protein [Bacillus halotolerans]WJE41306.1 hypothetical protein QRD86_11300 [Bacillus halotolerans]WOC55088.1 hypothetical protein RYX39_10850 [Bacillus halotolerans]WPC78781.1 hypothetical protein RA179_10740 [Bacillus halotolerans]
MQFVQRALDAKHSDEGQKGAFKLIGVYYIVVPGVTAFSFVWLRNRNADSVYPRLIIDLSPASLTGVFAAILFRAILSSFSGALNSTVTLFTLNIYKPMFKPDDGKGEIVKSGRIFVAASGLYPCHSTICFIRAIELYSYHQEVDGMSMNNEWRK